MPDDHTWYLDMQASYIKHKTSSKFPKGALSSCYKVHKSLGHFCQYPIIIEWFGLEGTVKGHLVQTPCKEQGHPPLDQVAESNGD